MSHKVRMGLDFHTSITEVDTVSLQTAVDVNLARNLFGRLVEVDSAGQLVADLADSLSWTENTITFVFGNKTRTVDGAAITAKDAEISLKRTLMQGQIGHGGLNRFLCTKNVLTSISDRCDDVHSEGNKLLIRVEKPSYIPLVLELLQSPDYSIIPIKSLDLQSAKLKITDFRNTSGPYYVALDSPTGSLKLRANPKSYHYNPDMPQEVEIVPVGVIDGQKKFLADELDLLPTTQIFSGADGEKIIRSGAYETHETLPFKVSIVTFSKKAIKEFSPLQRLKVAGLVANGLHSIIPNFGAISTAEFFQPLGDGALTASQSAELKHLNQQDAVIPRPLEITAGKSFIPVFEREFKHHPELQVGIANGPPFLLPEIERPDIFYFVTDSAWNESISLIGYNIEMGLFSLPGVDMNKWFQDYIDLESREERIKKLNRLHFELLRAASFVPYMASPYFAAIKKGWALNQSRLAAGTSIWQMRAN